MNKPALTVERLERALDLLSVKIEAHGERGRILLPIYIRLEDELAKMKAENAALAAALDRAKRSKDRTAARLP